MMFERPLLVSSGEPAGIGPDLCLSLADSPYPLVVLADKAVLAARAQVLNQRVILNDYQPGRACEAIPGQLTVLSIPCPHVVTAGELNSANASYVLELLSTAAQRCLQGEFSAVVTAPVHKAIINQAGVVFSGHTEFFADFCQVKHTVMMLACLAMRVALVTTHVPLSAVAQEISCDLLSGVVNTVHDALQLYFDCPHPTLYVAGLNPHAGEGGYLGREEIDVIIPTLKKLQEKGVDVQGPFPADTLFLRRGLEKPCDAYIAMYHDQGLPVLKYAGFAEAVNITLGLPIIRTSVDHGTALELAGTGQADSGSLWAAVEMARNMVAAQGKKHGAY